MLYAEHFDIYTDGSCKGHIGAWSYLILQDGKLVREKSGRENKTDCNRMESQAVIEALQSLAPNSVVTLHTDSRVLLENIPMFSVWESNGWLKKNGRPIPNVDLHKILFQLLKERTVIWKWIKAHSGNMFNDRCDELCALARE